MARFQSFRDLCVLSQIKTTGSGDIGGAKNDTQKQELHGNCCFTRVNMGKERNIPEGLIIDNQEVLAIS